MGGFDIQVVSKRLFYSPPERLSDRRIKLDILYINRYNTINHIYLINCIKLHQAGVILNTVVGSEFLSNFLQYLARLDKTNEEKLPALGELKVNLGISVSSLREQLEVARSLGLVEVHPRTGIKRLPYSFYKSLRQSLSYALAIKKENFHYYSDLRNHIETSYWELATSRLEIEDIKHLQGLVTLANVKLHGHPIHIPQTEHRELHLGMYKRLDNPFVIGLLEAYWDMYDAVGLNVYADYEYLERVWQYHQEIVDAIYKRDFSLGHRLLVEHINLLTERPDLKVYGNDNQAGNIDN